MVANIEEKVLTQKGYFPKRWGGSSLYIPLTEPLKKIGVTDCTCAIVVSVTSEKRIIIEKKD